jgi:chemotaxis protein MotB
MRRFSGLLCISILAVTVLLSGCLSQQQFDEMKSQNRIQQQRITGLESELDTANVKIEQCNKQSETLTNQGSANIEAKGQEITALEADIEGKKELISKMREQLLRSGVKLPIELSVMLQEFATGNDMVTFDSDAGILKFKSDLLFDPGSDLIGADAVGSIKQFCKIMKSKEAANFDIVIAGHTDDVPIKKAATKTKHPTNWHLSVHRAISVLNVITKSKIDSKRVSIRGFGEFRPLEANKSNKKGNSANRRVEIFVVPSGT